MKFSIIGADKDTGDTIEMTIEAPNEAAAQEAAHRKGIMVSRVAPVVLHQPAATPSPLPAPVYAPVEQGHYRGAPVINIALPRRGSSLGVVSLVLGILAFIICWIPLVNLLGVPLSALGLLLGLIGLVVAFTRKGASIGYPIAGSAVCGLALFIAITMTGALMGGLKKAGDQIIADSAKRNATNQTAVAAKEPEKDADQVATHADPPPVAEPAAARPSPVPEKPAKPSPPPVEWASAETPIKQGDVQVQVKAVKVGLIPLVDRREVTGKSKDSLLSIELEITNLSETKKLEYRTWGGRAVSFGTHTRLTDNFDNGYKVVNFGFGSNVAGSVESESVYPGKAIKDVIAFEEPVGKVEYLNLELPAEQFGGTGMLRIRIPASMIQR